MRKLVILYGSQTGTAQHLAEQIWRNSKMYHLSGTVMAMDDYDVKMLIEEKFAIFVVATTGQGDEPDNMIRFWKFLLRKNLPTTSLCGLNFAVLGLGDSKYPKFNFAAKRLHKRLVQLGANQMQTVGLCDDQHDIGYNAVYMPWITNVWNRLIEKSPIPIGLSKLADSPRQTRWDVEVIGKDLNEIDHDPFLLWQRDTSCDSEVIDNVRTTSKDHFQDVRLISIKKKGQKWSPGDVVYVRPQNSNENVDNFFNLLEEHNLGLYRNTTISVKAIDSEMPVPTFLRKPISLECLAKKYWDLNAIPRARAFELLSKNCSNELEKEKLLEFTSIEGQEEMFSYANRPRRTILEVLNDFPHATSALNVNILFELFQPIKQRPFSIASCAETNRVDILVAVVEYKTKLKTPRQGLCSNWLKSMQTGDAVRMWIRKGTFKLPEDVNIPLIMVGPGTGLAPFRSILLERELSGKTGGQIVLFFGCRNEKKDFHCEKDLKRMQKSGILKIFTAFSRDQDDKIYVQHLIENESELLKELILNQKGHILVSGSSKNMPQSVKEAFIKALGDAEYIENMIKCERYQEETW